MFHVVYKVIRIRSLVKGKMSLDNLFSHLMPKIRFPPVQTAPFDPLDVAAAGGGDGEPENA